jgi:hypothetical protein
MDVALGFQPWLFPQLSVLGYSGSVVDVAPMVLGESGNFVEITPVNTRCLGRARQEGAAPRWLWPFRVAPSLSHRPIRIPARHRQHPLSPSLQAPATIRNPRCRGCGRPRSPFRLTKGPLSAFGLELGSAFKRGCSSHAADWQGGHCLPPPPAPPVKGCLACVGKRTMFP